MSELSPVAIEGKLRALINDQTRAQRDLAQARNHEVELEHIYKRERRRAILGGDCPKVSRGGYTTAERDAWVEDRCANAEEAYDFAVAAREAATDHMRTLFSQSVAVSVLAKSVGQAYSFAGRGEGA